MPDLAVNGCNLNYEEVGSGEPMLYLAYTRFDSARMWAPYMEEHASGYRMILPDPRGMAGSDHIRDVNPRDWVADLAALLDALSLPAVHVCSETFGSRIATRFAADHPNRARTLILNAPIAYSSPEGDAERRKTANSATMPQDRQETMRRLHGEDWADVNRFYQDMHERSDFQRFYDLRRVAPRVRAPALVLRGDIDDPIHPVEHSTALHRRFPRSWLAIFPNTPFNVLRNRPRESWELIRTFTAAHS
jgi:pimeloyl-ACP methyl ester carboxylesterase